MLKETRDALIAQQQMMQASLDEAIKEVSARAWDEGHRTPREREPDDCKCGAWASYECGCGEYGNGKIITPNPYRAE